MGLIFLKSFIYITFIVVQFESPICANERNPHDYNWACERENLTEEERVERIDWALQCNYISQREFDFHHYEVTYPSYFTYEDDDVYTPTVPVDFNNIPGLSSQAPIYMREIWFRDLVADSCGYPKEFEVVVCSM